MKTPTYQDYLANPTAVLERVERQARRERAEAVHDFIVAPLLGLFKRALAQPAQIPQTRTA
jgi:hypothetical protein